MFVIGIDGGGTKTKACLMDESGVILGIGNSGPSSIDTVPLVTTIKCIKEAILECLDNKVYKIAAVYVGLGGIVTKEDSLKVSNELSKLSFLEDNALIISENDTRTALAGGLATREGISIIIGTGSVAYGRNDYGEEWISGGYGYKEGDAGSSYDLGRQCLKLLAKAIDGRIETTPFISSVSDYLGVQMNKSILVKVLDELWLNRTATAGLAPFVTKFANLGDSNALKIVHVATTELASLIKSVYKNVPLKNKQVAIIGSLGNAKGVFNEMFIQKVKDIDEEIEVIPQKLDPVVGAALQALKLKDILITEEIIKKYELIYE